MSLLDAFLADSESELSRPLYDAVISGMSPFKTGRIMMFTDYSIDCMRDRLVVKVENVPDIFEGWIDRSAFRDPETFYSNMAEKIFRFYRYRPYTEPKDHIILGEE